MFQFDTIRALRVDDDFLLPAPSMLMAWINFLTDALIMIKYKHKQIRSCCFTPSAIQTSSRTLISAGVWSSSCLSVHLSCYMFNITEECGCILKKIADSDCVIYCYTRSVFQFLSLLSPHAYFHCKSLNIYKCLARLESHLSSGVVRMRVRRCFDCVE